MSLTGFGQRAILSGRRGGPASIFSHAIGAPNSWTERLESHTSVPSGWLRWITSKETKTIHVWFCAASRGPGDTVWKQGSQSASYISVFQEYKDKAGFENLRGFRDHVGNKNVCDKAGKEPTGSGGV